MFRLVEASKDFFLSSLTQKEPSVTTEKSIDFTGRFLSNAKKLLLKFISEVLFFNHLYFIKLHYPNECVVISLCCKKVMFMFLLHTINNLEKSVFTKLNAQKIMDKENNR